MTISKEDWLRYIRKLSEVNAKASELMIQYVQKNGFGNTDELIEVAFSLADYYGEAAAAAACEMYDAIATAEGVIAPAAIPANTASYEEVAKAIQGTLNTAPSQVPQTVGRLVKQTGADTMLQNAQRDGAQFAWVPQGDTCAFCMTLASRGWQYMSKKALKNGHAEHIHSNCDCEYCIRFDNKSTVEGYDPDKYRRMYDEAEGDTPQEKINSMRRELEAKRRRLHYGKENDFETDRGIIHARRVDQYGYNNIYVDNRVSLNERELRIVDKQISSAKEILDITDTCDANVVVSDLGDDLLASYNPRTNTMLLNTKMTSEAEILRMQRGFACSEDVRSTAVHELLHWKDADEYRNAIGEIADIRSVGGYNQFQQERCLDLLEEQGIDIDKASEISEYARKSFLDNDWEEVYTEYRTKEVLS